MNILIAARERLFPSEADNRFDGHRTALWLLGLMVALKLLISVNSIVNTAKIAAGADGFPLDSFGPAAARSVLMLFALTSLGQLTLALVALTALIRYRALVPFVYLLLLAEQIARRLIIESYAVVRADSASAGWYLNIAILAALTLGSVLSMLPQRGRERS